VGWIVKKADSYLARYRDPNGRERSRSFRTKTAARRFLNDVEAAKDRGNWIDPAGAKLLFGDWADHHAETWLHLRAATRARAESLMRNHVLSRFDDCRLGIITPVDVQAWVNELIAEGLSASTVHGCYRIFSQVMDSAVTSNLIPVSPCRQIALPRLERTEMHFLMPEQIHSLAAACKGYSTLIYSAAYLGLRWGELAGLRRVRVNLLRQTVEVTEILTDVKGHLAFGPPKTTASRRSVSVPKFLKDMLEEQLKTRPPGDDALVFVGRDGAPLRASNFRRCHWKPAVARARLPEDLRFHDLRHTAASLLIAQGAHPKEIQSRLGHSSITTTLDRYGHLFPGLDDRLREGLDVLFRSATEGHST
jgi:integrase